HEPGRALEVFARGRDLVASTLADAERPQRARTLEIVLRGIDRAAQGREIVVGDRLGDLEARTTELRDRGEHVTAIARRGIVARDRARFLVARERVRRQEQFVEVLERRRMCGRGGSRTGREMLVTRRDLVLVDLLPEQVALALREGRRCRAR